MTSQEDSIDEAIRQGILPNLPFSEEEENLLNGDDGKDRTPPPFWEKPLAEAALTSSVGSVIKKLVEKELAKERENIKQALRQQEKMDVPTKTSTSTNETPLLITPNPQPLMASTQQGIQGANNLQKDLEELATFTVGVAADLNRAHLRLSEHIQYKETGRIPRGMQSGSTVNAFRSGDSKIAQDLAELKQQYHDGIIDLLIVHYNKVISKLEKDQKQANEREKTLRRRHPGSPLWENYEEHIKEATTDNTTQPTLFSRYSRKRASGNTHTNDTTHLNISSTSSRPKNTTGITTEENATTATREEAPTATLAEEDSSVEVETVVTEAKTKTVYFPVRSIKNKI